jgi:hypothetical protein
MKWRIGEWFRVHPGPRKRVQTIAEMGPGNAQSEAWESILQSSSPDRIVWARNIPRALGHECPEMVAALKDCVPGDGVPESYLACMKSCYWCHAPLPPFVASPPAGDV